MSEILVAIRGAGDKVTVIAVIDILIVAFLIYQFAVNLRGRRAAQVMIGVLMLLFIYIGAALLGLELLSSILSNLAPYTAITMVILFQSEIRRILARIGRNKLFGFTDQLERRESAEEILLAMQYLSQTQTGALIVIERDAGLKTFIETGVSLDAQISRDLLLSIFFPGAPLHDGAVIVQGDRMAAGACLLPLTLNPALMNSLGTRHRAAIGITEETDCLALVVSEETGKLSYAIHGEIHQGVTLDEIEKQLTGRKTPQRPASPSGHITNEKEHMSHSS